MQHKRFFLLGMCLGTLALTACGPKGIDDADLVSIDYKYSLDNGTIVEQGNKEIIMGASDSWIESIIVGANQEDEFVGTIAGNEIYGSEHNPDKIQSFANIILKEVMGISDPKVGEEIAISTMGTGIIVSIEKDEDGYDTYVVDFNDPKTYSDLSYYIKITNVEKL